MLKRHKSMPGKVEGGKMSEIYKVHGQMQQINKRVL